MSARAFSIFAAVFFLALAAVHFARAVGAMQMEIIVGHYSLPTALSWGAFAVAGALAFVGFRAARR